MSKNINVPKLRFSEFSGGWEETTIGNVSKIYGRIGYRGYTVEDIVEKGNGAITLSPSNFNDNKINIEKSTYISWYKYEESPEIKIYNGDILFVKTGSTYGKTAYVIGLKEKATINPQIVVLKDININNIFLFYIVSHSIIKKQIEQLVVGGAIPTMSQKELAKMKFLLPSKQEQEKIASFLSSIDTKIEQLTKKESLLQEYKKGVMQKIFNQEIRFKADDGSEFCDWEKEKLGRYIDLLSGFAFKGDEISEKKEGLILLRGINITEGRIRHTKDIDRFYNGELEKLEKYFVKENDLVISMDGSKVGKNVALITKKDNNSLLVQRVARIRANKNSEINFIFQIIWSQYFVKYVDTVNTSSGIPHISSQQIKDFKFKFPCLQEQIKIGSFLSAIDKKIENAKRELQKTKEFKKALLQQMFV